MRKTSINLEQLLLDEYQTRDAAHNHDFDPTNLEDPIKPPPPPPTESLKAFRQRIEALITHLPEPGAVTSRHPIVQKLIDYDKQLIAEQKRGGWTSPTYQSEKGKLSLEWLNVLLHQFEALGIKVNLRGKKYFRFEVPFLHSYREFVFFISSKDYTPLRDNPKRSKQPITYCFRWNHGTDPTDKIYQFEKITADCVKRIVMDIVMSNEEWYRRKVVENYQWNVERRKQAIRDRHEAIELEARKKRLAIAQLLKKREGMMTNALANMEAADRIRQLIEVIRIKSDASRQPIKNLDRWIGWATHHANTIDPRHMSAHGIEAWIEKFALKD